MTEIEILLKANYFECWNYLLKKYGAVHGDYFLILDCSINNSKIKRGKEGLYLHHIDGDKAIFLSNPEFARKKPDDYQRSYRLVYCNLLEHLLLHLKIFEFPDGDANEGENVGAEEITKFLVPELNDIYAGIYYTKPWKRKVCELVRPLKEDYLKCIKKLVDLDFGLPLLTSLIYNEKAGILSIGRNWWPFVELNKLGVKQ